MIMVNWENVKPCHDARWTTPLWRDVPWQPYGVFYPPYGSAGLPWGAERGWFTDSYPELAPYYPIPTAQTQWIHPWIYPPYEGYWWS